MDRILAIAWLVFLLPGSGCTRQQFAVGAAEDHAVRSIDALNENLRRDSAALTPIQLLNQYGTAVSWNEPASLTLLSFFYTGCPDAGMCPLTVSGIRTALAELPAAIRSRLRVRLVTLDPENDTPPRLLAYALSYHLAVSDVQIQLLTGSTGDLNQILSSFFMGQTMHPSVHPSAHPSAADVSMETHHHATSHSAEQTTTPADLSAERPHMLSTLLLNQQGQVVKRFGGGALDPPQLAAAIRTFAEIDKIE